MDTHHPAIEKRISEDGSSTLYRPDIDEHYHSIHGAIQESEHIFIRAGLDYFTGQDVSILEIGFGTGLNALLTLMIRNGRHIRYHAIEKWPLDEDLMAGINYPECLSSKNPEAEKHFRKLHESHWNQTSCITPWFTLLKENIDLRSFNPTGPYDVVYFDAFAPDKQPELWTPEIFKKIAEAMNKGGILTTYSAKGTVKRALTEAGMTIFKLPGPPGKRDIIRAIKK
ncbi:MAG: tRNA (5-methylaminomethyl-2-thiouridine)(34)-methyltransferase MnmD [Bacteroidota bacterium]